MSEVSVEAEDPRVDFEEVEKEGLSEDNTHDSGGGKDRADEMYEVDINSDGENAGVRGSGGQEDKDAQNDKVASGGVGSGELEAKGHRETPEENGDSHSDVKGRTMAEGLHRGSAAEIPVTSNGDLDQSPDTVFHRDSYSSRPAPPPTSFASPVEGIVESGSYKGTQPNSGPVVLSDDLKNPAMEKLDLVRKWSINTYKCTRQILSEKLGRGSRTVDLELEAQIELLRDNKRKYQNVIKLTQTLANQLSQIIQTQRQLGDAFADLSLKSPELHEEFGYNADTQKLLSKNGETLLGAMNFFISSVNTLVDKTIEDTMINIKQYETARVEYDAYRTDLEELNLGPRDANTMPKIEQSQQQFQIHREKYERMRADVSVKLKFLEENKVKVLHNQLILFHNAIAAYYAGNQQQLEETLKQFHIKLKMPGGESPSWLEEH
ncbi:arfaptin-1 isoform X2 [Oryzias latipes]|uniref:arfaptin-1 isoform X2 n=2 Tax=Oryzias latipes TaxID=8090 RepID=UPI000CE21232|nr:arfaptin-1 isoform X2 [Oryzias latipes]